MVEWGFVGVLVVAFGVLAGIFGYLAVRMGKAVRMGEALRFGKNRQTGK